MDRIYRTGSPIYKPWSEVWPFGRGTFLRGRKRKPMVINHFTSVLGWSSKHTPWNSQQVCPCFSVSFGEQVCQFSGANLLVVLGRVTNIGKKVCVCVFFFWGGDGKKTQKSARNTDPPAVLMSVDGSKQAASWILRKPLRFCKKVEYSTLSLFCVSRNNNNHIFT